MKITLIISTLDGGGAERIMSILANAWADRGDEITLITIGDVGSDKYELIPEVHRRALDLLRPSGNFVSAIINNWFRVQALRKAIRESQADLVLSFLTETNILTLLSVIGLGIPVVVAERTSLANQRPRGAWNWIWVYMYRRASAVVAQTKDAAAWLERELKAPVSIIHNPLSESVVELSGSSCQCDSSLKNKQNLLMAMGRLSREKGFDLLLEAFAKTAISYPQWRLVILGEGCERRNLERLAFDLGISRQVELPGFCRHPQRMLKAADAFVLSSRHEGMPNALMEAMASGLPCVSFDCPCGPSELITDGVDGLLVPSENVNELAEALAKIMGSDPLRKALGSAASHIRTRLGLEAVLEEWDALFDGILENRGRHSKRVHRIRVDGVGVSRGEDRVVDHVKKDDV